MSKVISVGLCKARHGMPVSECVFPNTIENPADYNFMHKTCVEWVSKHCDVHIHWDTAMPINGADQGSCYESDVRVNLYVTGLTAATAAFIKVCAMNGVGLSLMHYDPNTGAYNEQYMF